MKLWIHPITSPSETEPTPPARSKPWRAMVYMYVRNSWFSCTRCRNGFMVSARKYSESMASTSRERTTRRSPFQ